MADLIHTVRSEFPKKTVVVVGDLVADQFLSGTISRVSREAPVFILKHDATETRPGAAANAACNVASLGASAIVIGVAGIDANGDRLVKAIAAAGVECGRILRDESVTTTTKVRVLAGQTYAARQQVIRIDYENEKPLGDELSRRLIDLFEQAATTADAIIFSDYGCGTIFSEIYEKALAISARRNIPLIVDSRHRLTEFASASSATPNREEVEQILGRAFNSDDCSGLRERLGFQALLVTNGNKGMTVFEAGGRPVVIDAVGSLEPVDVTGAGDTVIAAYALGLASGLSFVDAARIANHAGGIVVMKKGTAVVTADELADSIIEASAFGTSG